MANRLINEQSPYLLQHAQNPVDWYPWGDEAFLRAKGENKPVIVSIGYAACHWCHVMEHESFEDDATAAYMNEHFVCIKVDREEHPDVDHMYMDAVQALSGSGGWPLNVFVTPERIPFYGGTYYPPRAAYNRPSWMQLLQRMNQVWQHQPGEITAQAEQMVNYLTEASQRTFATAATTLNEETCRKIADTLLQQADKEKGGFGNAPKFPGTMAISYLLEHYHFTGYEPALDHALHSLDAMIEGGIYDQLGGGFARYATDRNWLVPHFEKMLYDNALLVSCMCDAYSIMRDDKYKRIIEETIAFAERELKDKSGAYYCALDADSEGEEGKFYTWTWQQWLDTANDENGIAAQYFGVTPGGNWEQTNILHVAKSAKEIASENKLTVAHVQQVVDAVKQNLFAARSSRIRPLTDDKSLLSWNALMNIGLCKAGVVLQHNDYVVRAQQHMQWMTGAFYTDKKLLHAWKDGVARIPAKLDDYAYMIQALLQLASAAGDDKWILLANELTEAVVAEFSRADGFFYYTPATQKDIPVRKVDLYDGATPSANSVMAYNLWICGVCMERSEWVERSLEMLHKMSDTAMRYSYSFGYWALLMQRHVSGLNTIICAGTGAVAARQQLEAFFIPQAYLITSQKEISEVPVLGKKDNAGPLQVFICTEKACLSPVSSVDAAFGLLKGRHGNSGKEAVLPLGERY